jgi:hypothetical protein
MARQKRLVFAPAKAVGKHTMFYGEVNKRLAHIMQALEKMGYKSRKTLLNIRHIEHRREKV